MSDELLLTELALQRDHVLHVVDGLTEAEMGGSLVPSRWSITSLLNHLAFDNEMFWISAVLGGESEAIAALHNGWASRSMTGTEAVKIYKHEIRRSSRILAKVNLDDPPRWWPPASDFAAQPMHQGREVVCRVLIETATHAGHLDIVRELVDGHQNLVVN